MDRRRDPRTSVSFPVDVLSYSVRARDEGRLVDLGAGGGFLELSGNYGVGSTLRMGFALPSPPSRAITCTVIIRRRLAKGVGVEFLLLEPRDRDCIRGFVTRNLGE